MTEEEIQKKLEELEQNDLDLSKKTEIIKESDAKQDTSIEELKKISGQHEEKISNLGEADSKIFSKMEELEKNDSQLQEAVGALKESDAKQDTSIEELKKISGQHEEKISNLGEADSKIFSKIEDLEKSESQLKESLGALEEVDANIISSIEDLKGKISGTNHEVLVDFTVFLLEKTLVNRIELINQQSKFEQLLFQLKKEGVLSTEVVTRILEQGARTQASFADKNSVVKGFDCAVDELNAKHETNIKGQFVENIVEFFAEKASEYNTNLVDQEKANDIANYDVSILAQDLEVVG